MNNTSNPFSSFDAQSKDTKFKTNLNEPIDFNTIENEVNVDDNIFPTDVFPTIFKDLIFDLKKSLNFPTDYTGTAILTAIAATIGTTAKVKVKGSWYEYASLYSVIVGNAGANKTHPVNQMFNILRDIDKLAINKYANDYSEYEEYLNLDKKTKLLTPKINKPILIKSILTNFTPEILYQRLNDNQRGCTVLSDELTTFLEGMNNYSKGDQTSVYLSMWSHQPTSIDRVGNPIPLFIKNPFLNIIGSLQPRMLKQSFPIHKMNNGFLQRFLFAFPSDTNKEPINDNEVNSELLNNYNSFISNYIKEHPVNTNFETGVIDSKIYYWSNEAKEYFYNWQKQNCDLVNNNQNSVKAEIITKFDNHFVRLALILQVMENYNTYEISLKAVKSASELCNYFMNNAFKILAIIQDQKTYIDALPLNKKTLYNELPITFTTETAISIGAKCNVLERTVKDFIKDVLLFSKLKHGNYKKIIKN
ncbi:MAG: DUF3987 domain-containing protein [Bacteroidia bacterium]|nr:DUF3987 domain-containing protein [Bacteroidia bacterium]